MKNNLTYRERKDLEDRGNSYFNRAVSVLMIGSLCYFGGGILRCIGSQENNNMAGQHDQKPIEQSYMEDVTTGLGKLTNDLVVDPSKEIIESSQKSMKSLTETAKNAWYEIKNTNF